MPITDNANKKLLVITYYWPPAGGPGVQRWLKFVNYLSDAGFDLSILTVDEHSASYALTDPSLLEEVHPNIRVYKTRTREFYNLYLKITKKQKVPFSGFVHENKQGLKEKIIRFVRTHLFIPDPRKGWNRFAIQKATEIIKDSGITHIITTSPPHSTHLIGLTLRKRFPAIKWLADFRDPWTHIFYFNQLNHSFISRRIHRRLEGNIIARADKTIVVSPSMKRDFLNDHAKRVTEQKIIVIPNGYDRKDFMVAQPLPWHRFTITYTGTLAENYRIDSFIEVVAGLNLEFQGGITLRFIGEICNTYRSRMEGMLDHTAFVVMQPVSHQKAIEYLLRSQMLLLVIPDAPENEAILTGKLFEYLAARKPILGIGPGSGDAAALLTETRAGRMFGYEDRNAMKTFLIDKVGLFNSGQNLWQGENIDKYSREFQTEQLIQLLYQPK
jgi:glycosyltransferase involved in cell wall biosynthesis